MRGEPRGFGAGAAGEAVPPREPQLGGRPGDIARLPGCRALPLPPAPAAPRGLRSPRPPKTQQGGWGQRQAGSPMQQWGRGGAADLLPSGAAGKGGICKPACNSNAAVEGGGRGEDSTTSPVKCLAPSPYLFKEHLLSIAARMGICFRSLLRTKTPCPFLLKIKLGPFFFFFFCGVLAFNSF